MSRVRSPGHRVLWMHICGRDAEQCYTCTEFGLEQFKHTNYDLARSSTLLCGFVNRRDISSGNGIHG